jgi:hypothetical protein
MRWILRTSGVFLFSSLLLTSPASADPHFSVQFGVGPFYGAVYPGYGYYPGYAYYTGYAYYPGYAYPGYGYYPGYVYPRYAYPRYGWRDGYRGWGGHGYYRGGGRYVRPYAGTAGRWSHGHGGWHGGHGH